MITAFVTAVFLTVALAFSIRNMPIPIKKLVLMTPAWAQDVLLYLGYANWIGGVTGHMLGAPLAVAWYFIYKYWLKAELVADVKAYDVSRKDLIKSAVSTVKGWLGQAGEVSLEIKDACTAQS